MEEWCQVKNQSVCLASIVRRQTISRKDWRPLAGSSGMWMEKDVFQWVCSGIPPRKVVGRHFRSLWWHKAERVRLHWKYCEISSDAGRYLWIDGMITTESTSIDTVSDHKRNFAKRSFLSLWKIRSEPPNEKISSIFLLSSIRWDSSDIWRRLVCIWLPEGSRKWITRKLPGF